MAFKRILVVDDEELARERIVRFLRESLLDLEIQEASDGLSAIEKIPSFKPDLVFLDIQMPGLNGFEVLQNLEAKNFSFVFQTAFDEFAVRAFDENACDYLLKPFTKERFLRAFTRAQERRSEQLRQLEVSLAKNKKYLEKLVIKKNGRFQTIDLKEVSHFVSQDHYTCAYVRGIEEIVDLSLQHLEQQVDPECFIRTHRSSLVSMKAIESLGDSSHGELLLKDGTKLPLSRHRRQEVLRRFRQTPL